MKLLVTIHIVLFSFLGVAQTNLDSLFSIWENEAKHDTVRLVAMTQIAWNGYLFSQPDSAFYFAQLQYDFAKRKGNERFMAKALSIQGGSYYIRGELSTAIVFYERCLVIQHKIDDKEGISSSLNNLGIMYLNQGDYAKAIDYNIKSLVIAEESGDEYAISASLNNIGVLYKDQGEFDKAMDYQSRALLIREELGDKKGVASSLNNIGILYDSQKQYITAIEYYERSLLIYEDIKDQQGIAAALNNIGILHQSIGNNDLAMRYYNRSLKINEATGRKQPYAVALNCIATIHNEQNDFSAAIKYSSESLAIAEEIGAIKETKEAANTLYEAYQKKGENKLALEMYELYITMRDSIAGEENQKEIIRQGFKYSYEKQAASDSIKQGESQKVSDALLAAEKAENSHHILEAKQQSQFAYFLYGLLGLTVLFGVFIFNRFRITTKQKDIIKDQKEKVDNAFDELEEKNQEILDSINYAKRIQNAILPPAKVVKEYLKESFILYKPKDIVAGDFYWLEHTKGIVLFAAADCTGHGVPGAMVSVVCNNGLNRAVREHRLTNPGEILNKTREIIIEEFEKSEEDVKDGMDIALCSLEGNTLKYAGAHNPLWLIRNCEIIETKANKEPIGKFINQTPYTTHTFELQKGDTFYIFSDGYVDQFGGSKGKKFKAKSFRELLLSIQNKPMEDQHKIIDNSFEKWRGELEQIDDVCIIGVRV